MKDFKPYSQVCFDALRANVDNWSDPANHRPITRIFYDLVFCSGYNHTGLISEEALNNPTQRTDDHCLSPQFICRMIMDNPDKYLGDYDTFEMLFFLSRTTIKVAKEENDKLSALTDNKGDTYKVFVPTNLKYKHLGIKLYEKKGHRWTSAVECDDNEITQAPSDLLEYERNFLVS